MALNIRRVGEVADGSVTAAKLADDAVDLAGNKVTGQLPTENLADGAVINTKLADLAVSTGKIQDDAITLAKADNDIRLSSYVGDETLVEVTGVTPVAVKEYNYPKMSMMGTGYSKLRIIATLKTNVVDYTATLEVFLDAEATPRLALTSVATDYELVAGDFSITDLSDNSTHKVTIKLSSSDAAGIVYNDIIDALFVK